MADVLIFADTLRSPELRHEVPIPIPDPLVYLERNGRRFVFAGSLELPRLAELRDIKAAPLERLGLDELTKDGLRSHALDRELVLRACREVGVSVAVAPAGFPLDVADHLRLNGIELTAAGELFDDRRRVKNERELTGIRRAQRAAERAMDAMRVRLQRGQTTCEELREEAHRAFVAASAAVPDIVIVSHGAQTAVGHEPGSGPIAPGEPIVVDLFPRDPESGCFADMTRTFCVGEPPEELVEYHGLCREALDRVCASVRPGVPGSELHRIACSVFEEAGQPTQLSKRSGEVLERGFFHALGHGVGLEVHERPYLGRNGEEIVAGDVLAIEPGCYRPGFGGCRLENLVHVTEDGCEVLTDYPYDLAP